MDHIRWGHFASLGVTTVLTQFRPAREGWHTITDVTARIPQRSGFALGCQIAARVIVSDFPRSRCPWREAKVPSRRQSDGRWQLLQTLGCGAVGTTKSPASIRRTIRSTLRRASSISWTLLPTVMRASSAIGCAVQEICIRSGNRPWICSIIGAWAATRQT